MPEPIPRNRRADRRDQPRHASSEYLLDEQLPMDFLADVMPVQPEEDQATVGPIVPRPRPPLTATRTARPERLSLAFPWKGVRNTVGLVLAFVVVAVAAVVAKNSFDAVDLRDLRVGECASTLPYKSKLNADRPRVVPCSNSAARVEFLGHVAPGKESECRDGNVGWQMDDSTNYCFRYILHIGVCYPARIDNLTGHFDAYFNKPHSCDESLDSRHLPIPDESSHVGDIRAVDIVPEAEKARCMNLSFTVGRSGLTVCAIAI